MPTNQQTNRNIQVRLELTDVRDMSFHDRFQNPARRRSEQGFTLVELMVVVLIIGVLLGIAIPTFLGARSRSQDSVAKSSVKLATTAVITEVMAGGEPDFDKISKQETSISWTDGPSDGPKQVSISGGNNGDDSGGWAGFAAKSESGTCWLMKGYGNESGYQGLYFGSIETDNCTGDLAENVSDDQW